MTNKNDPNYGKGVARLDFDDDVLLDEEEITKRLVDTLGAPDYQPPTLPAVAIELMALAQKPDVSFDEVAALLEQDAMIAGRVMKLVRSPIYAGAGEIKSIKQALVRIGLKSLRDIVLEVSLNTRVFRGDSYTDTMERLRRHCTATAHLSRIVCRYSAIDGEYAFLCGLLHDVGIAGCLLALAEGAGPKGPPDLIAVWPAIDRAHAEAASHMARLWSLPAEIQMVLAAHHQVLIQGYPHPLAATVALANHIAIEQGFGLLPQVADDADRAAADEDEAAELEVDAATCLASHTAIDRTSPKTLEHARAALEIRDEQMELIRADFDALRQELDGGTAVSGE